ncbi:type I secretion system permease/ATPase [Sphingomonas ginkgonis]|uniref:Type I secretion system permease/ATPase n=1 Tax=Sphingomonas ginkgonis TaxID=2315330 RepID=A0A429VE26_9SPHN|nr:type I secretion system permease/ATPase [Sphingomonas ginkgonis]RST32102.1 type I secretion system permease/ATPase [Sphingomonas ginkgonis]
MNWLDSGSPRELDPVLDCLSFIARRSDRPSSPVLLRAGLALSDRGTLPFHQIEPALDQVGMRSFPLTRNLRRWPAAKLPAILELEDERAAVLLELNGGDALVYAPGAPEPMWVAIDELAGAFTGEAVFVEADPTRERMSERPWDHARRHHWFWAEVWKVRRELSPVLLAALVVNLLAFAMPLFTMHVYDRVIPNKAIPTLWVLALGVVLALALDFTLRLARSQLIDEVGRKLDGKLSQKLFEKVMNLPLAQRQGSTGAIARRVSEYEMVRDFFASTTVVLLVDISFLLLFLGLITILAGWLVLVPVVGIVLMVAAGMTLRRAMGRTALDAQADSSLQHSVLVESIGGLETLKAARAEGQMLGRWKRYSSNSAATQEKMRRLTAVAVNLASVSQQLISIGLLIGGFYMFNEGHMTMGAIIAIVMIAGRALAPVGQFAFLVTRARQAFATLDSLQRMMDSEDERHAATRSIVPEIRSGTIVLDHVQFRYPNAARDSLADVSLTIRPGERIGIIGRVASGKSTLGRLLCGLYAPSEGVLTVDGLDSRQYHPHQLREAFRFVGQDAELFSGTVRDNLMLGAAQASDEQLIEAVVKSGADIFLSRDAAGFDLPVGERGGHLSGGQRSLLVLARALVSPSKLLFLDEPTGAMDTQTEAYFIDHLKTAVAPDQTLVVSTHRHQMLSIVDRLIVIDGGRILADGPRDKVMQQLSAAAQAAAAPKAAAR